MQTFSLRKYDSFFIKLTVVTVLLFPTVLVAQTVPEKKDRGAAEDLARWARQPSSGPEGRPLPLTGGWAASGNIGPSSFVEKIKDGHHVLPTFKDPNFTAAGAYLHDRGEEKADKQIETYYKPSLKFASKHGLPIAIRGWNWGDRVGMYEDAIAGEERSLEETARMVIDGKKQKKIDPFGPIERWREWGSFWFGNPMMKRLQEIYPDPPMVVFLNNNEGPKVRDAAQVPDDYERMLEFLDGEAPENKREKERAIRAGYRERYRALFSAALEALEKEAWRENVKFVAYNNLWDTAYIGKGNRPRPDIWFERDEGWMEWKMFDGGMPELYDNDWQPGKQNHRPWSPQTEAMNYYSTQDRIFEQDPDFYWASIVWDGGRMHDLWRGRRGTSKTFHYASRGQRWDFARHEGWVQFVLWMTRPRTLREFRHPGHDRHAYDEGTFHALLRSVDRPWEHELLRAFWRHGEPVPNPEEDHWFELDKNQPDWVRDLERWYLLTCDANPPRQEWTKESKLRVFALSLVRGEPPERRWLIYAHAPLGAVAEPTVTVPGYGDVTLESVPKSGSFFLLDEKSGEVETVLTGGPNELSVRADRRYTEPGENVQISVAPAHAPAMELTDVRIDFGDGQDATLNGPGEVRHAYNDRGTYMVTVEATGENGHSLTKQMTVHVGEPPEESVVYDLPLNRAFAWEGPWGDSGEPNHELVTYQHLPNRGTLPQPVMVGGTFVKDEQRGTVLEINGDVHDGVYMMRGRRTNMRKEGFANKTVTVSFKADRTEGRQVLYAEGSHHAGLNIYLDGDTLYAGAFAPVDGKAFDWHPVYGRNWEGDWTRFAGVKPDTWYDVKLQMTNTTEDVRDNRMHLYVNGEQEDSAPAARLPRTPAGPRLGRTHLDGREKLLTRFHDEQKEARVFSGRLSRFRLVNKTKDEER